MTTPKRRPRSAVTSRRKLWIDGDPNSAWSRRYADLVHRHVSDCGGESALSEAKLSLARRASALECELELLEGRMSQGEQVDLNTYGRAASHLRRILESLGLERTPRDITDAIAALPYSPLRARWAAEAAAEAQTTTKDTP
jgi:hypothetical protein